MFKTSYLIAILAVLLLAGGCTTAETLAKGVSEKSISGSGTFVYSRVGLDTATQTPELMNLFVWGDYTSVVPGDEIFRYEEVEDASIFNSDAKTKKKKIFFATGDKARMEDVISAVTKGGSTNANQSD